jgi:hypothetical protein
VRYCRVWCPGRRAASVRKGARYRPPPIPNALEGSHSGSGHGGITTDSLIFNVGLCDRELVSIPRTNTLPRLAAPTWGCSCRAEGGLLTLPRTLSRPSCKVSRRCLTSDFSATVPSTKNFAGPVRVVGVTRFVARSWAQTRGHAVHLHQQPAGQLARAHAPGAGGRARREAHPGPHFAGR